MGLDFMSVVSQMVVSTGDCHCVLARDRRPNQDQGDRAPTGHELGELMLPDVS